MQTFDATPRAASLIESLRDVGYSMETALADIVDNSIAAGASYVEILANPPGNEAGRIGIVDDGCGMSRTQLQNAMRPGSRNPLDNREEGDLGRFGLGMKTASFSQCRRLTVVTRHSGETNAAIWDLDYVASTNEWLVQIPSELKGVPWVNQIPESGTLVLWEHLDRIGGSADDSASFNQAVAQSMSHLELIFHRFLAPEQPGKKSLRILINGTQLTPLDPFNERNSATDPSPVEVIPMGDTKIRVQGFTLPHHSKVSASEWERHALPGGYLKNQGFYVYRERRLIIYGTWFRLKNQSESTKLTRVRVDVPSALDSQWKLDIKKESAQPPTEVRRRLSQIVDLFREPSKRAITRRASISLPDETVSLWQRQQLRNEIHYRLNMDHPLLERFHSTLTTEKQRDFRRIVELIQASLPKNALYSDMAGNPDSIVTGEVSDCDLRELLETALKLLAEQGLNPEAAIELILHAEPFYSHYNRTLNIFKLVQKENHE